MRLAVVAAGFTQGKRINYGVQWERRRPGVIEEFNRKLTDGMLANGLTREFAEQVFNQIRGLGNTDFRVTCC